jgi:hypothetical protein
MEMLKSAQARADARFNHGEVQENKLLQYIADLVIRDRLIAPKAMRFVVTDSGVRLCYPNEDTYYSIHRHALGQLAGKVELPITYLNKLDVQSTNDWRRTLLIDNLNTLFQSIDFEKGSENARFLHRIVGNELRGFLSRRFNRHLASLPLLRAFVESVREAGAKPIEATSTDLRWTLKCYLPQVFEAFPGQFICVGVSESNSDFGAGKLSITQTIWDPLRDTRSVLDESISRVHLGSVLEDSDIEVSDDTAVKEVEAQAGAIRDAVTQLLAPEAIDKALKAIKLAHEQEIPWHQLKGQLARILYEKELATVETLLASPDVIDLPPVGRTASGDPLPTKWWASSVVSRLASNLDDDRKMELQQFAGKFLGGA